MRRLPISSEEAASAVRKMGLLLEIKWQLFDEASKPQRSAAAIERDRQRRQEAAQQNEETTPADKD